MIKNGSNSANRLKFHMVRQYFCEQITKIVYFFWNYAVCWALITNSIGFLVGSKHVKHKFLFRAQQKQMILVIRAKQTA